MLLGLLVLLAGTGVPTGMAHNPGAIVYAPVPLDDGFLVAGAEATFASLDTDGQVRWTADASGQVELLHGPVRSGQLAAVAGLTHPEERPVVIGLDGQGIAWETTVDTPGVSPWALPAPDAFALVTDDGTLRHLDDQGTVVSQTQLPIEPNAPPRVVPGTGYLVRDWGDLRLVSWQGDELARASLQGIPAAYAISQGQVIVGLAKQGTDHATVVAFDRSSEGLDRTWTLQLPGSRIGQNIALDGQQAYLGTYSASGAAVYALDRTDGSIAWSQALANATAASVTRHAEALYVSHSDGVSRLGLDGTIAWTSQATPLIAPPTVTDELVLPAGSANRLVALHAGDGSVAWTWSDPVEVPDWVADPGAPADDGSGSDPLGVPAPGAGLGVLAGAAASIGALALRLGAPRRR